MNATPRPENWLARRANEVTSVGGEFLAGFRYGHHRDEAVAAVNACAELGVEPDELVAKVRELLEAAEGVLPFAHTWVGNVHEQVTGRAAVKKARAAIDAFKPQTQAEGHDEG